MRYLGTCLYCGQEVTRRTAARHLANCAPRQLTIQQAQAKRRPQQLLCHIRANADHLPEFWLDLEVNGTATLQDVDRYLRAIWLECCGHMSQFSAAGWGSQEFAMRRVVGDVFPKGASLTHIYDFGTESVTTLTCLTVRTGKPTTNRPIALMVRNQLPAVVCIECGQPAAWLCMECIIEDDLMGFLCDAHRDQHPHDNYDEPLAVVNSPRLGLCGYTGPADPPY